MSEPILSKQFSAACERNREPIFAQLQIWLQDKTRVLEIGSGSGQHAAYFAPQLPHIAWQSSDLPENHPSILAWQASAMTPNFLPPLALDMAQQHWAQSVATVGIDCIYTANTCHIMPWPAVQNMLAGAARLLPPDGSLLIYGPFNENGSFTSASNQAFDASLRQRAAHMGLRDLAEMQHEAALHGLILQQKCAMPANNLFLRWQHG